MRKFLTIAALMSLVIACTKTEKTSETQTATHGSAQTATAKAESQEPATPATATGTAVGAMMPAYKATLLDGKPFDIAAERGNVVFLNLWATWCGPCRFEIPELQKLHDEYASKNFKVVGVSLDEGGKDAVQQFVTEQKMTYPIALDPEGNLANVFQTTVIPTSVLIDRKGKIVWKRFGAVTVDSELKQALEDALK